MSVEGVLLGADFRHVVGLHMLEHGTSKAFDLGGVGASPPYAAVKVSPVLDEDVHVPHGEHSSLEHLSHEKANQIY